MTARRTTKLTDRQTCTDRATPLPDGEQIRMEQAMRCMTSTDTTRMKAATGRRITGNRKHNNTGYPWKHAIKICGQISGYPVCVHNI